MVNPPALTSIRRSLARTLGYTRIMKKMGFGIWGVVLLTVGAAGLVVAPAFFAGPSAVGPFASLGEQIYYTGSDAEGPVPRSIAGAGMMGSGMMNAFACVDCHGQDGRGGRVSTMFGTVDVPDIRYSALTTAHVEGTQTIPAWTDADIGLAIRDGIEPNGEPIKAPMPRWRMTDADVAAVIAYLKELSRQ